ncbi:MAG: NAD-dependent epimerase/dehydratase family protein [Planctomycetia bacterium]
MQRMVVTGAAGFIGFHLCRRLLDEGWRVVGLDNLNPYYDVDLKRARVDLLRRSPGFSFAEIELADDAAVRSAFAEPPQGVVHLAAQAGVRYSTKNPQAYVASNVAGFVNVIEAARTAGAGHFVYASSSSVYGANTKRPFAETDACDHPLSLYAATKRANELIAHTYSHLYGLPTTGLRFFTVYGPWGRPDMALYLFTKAIYAGLPIDVYNEGRQTRDFTYVDDVVDGLMRVAAKPPTASSPIEDAPTPAAAAAPYRVYNLGHSQPVPLMDFIRLLEKTIGRPAKYNFLPMQDGDVSNTAADMTAFERDFGPSASTPIEVGVPKFVEWYRGYNKID